jgi:hypothetical protein
MSLPR